MEGAWALGPLMERIRILLDNIRFEHTIFALPFAYLGMVLAARGLPTFWQFFWITVAMASARTLAMSLNRLIDWEIDSGNPRTSGRPLPTGRLSPREVLLFSIVSLFLFVFAAFLLNELCVRLLPIAVVILVGYSYTKRFTWMSHYILGIADGIAPVGGWVAVTGTLSLEPVILGLAVALWIAGFDLIYACQDVDFDRANSLYSVPALFGIQAALTWAGITHLLTIVLLAMLGVISALGWPYWVGLTIASGLILYEHSLVKADDLSKLNIAFFNVNGYVAVIMFVFTFGALIS